MKKRILAFLLALSMIACLAPCGVFADGTGLPAAAVGKVDRTAQTVTGSNFDDEVLSINFNELKENFGIDLTDLPSYPILDFSDDFGNVNADALLANAKELTKMLPDAEYLFAADTAVTDNDYDNWYADFVVSFDQPIAKNSLGLVGYYTSSSWKVPVGFLAPIELAAGTKVPLLNTVMNLKNWTYSQIRSDVQSFVCGAFNLSDENVGTTMSVELRIFSPDFESTDAICDASNWAENDNTFLIKKYDYTFDKADAITVGEDTYTYAGTADKGEAFPAEKYYIAGGEMTFSDGTMTAGNDRTAYFEKSVVAVEVEVPADEKIKEILPDTVPDEDKEAVKKEIKQIVATPAVAKMTAAETGIDKAINVVENKDALVELLVKEAKEDSIKEEVMKKGSEDISKSISIDLDTVNVSAVTLTESDTKTTTKTTEIIYDVKPIVTTVIKDESGEVVETVKAEITRDLIKSPITFRLGVSAFGRGKKAIVTHNDKFFGLYDVLGNETDGFYVEVASMDFSPYGVIIVDEDTIQTATSDELAFKAISLTLANDLSLNYKVTVADSLTDAYVSFTRHSADGDFTQTVSESAPDNGRLCFKYTGLNPQCMTDLIDATLYAKKADGTWLKVSYNNYSVQKYLGSVLPKTADPLMKEVLANLAEYGAAAQAYNNYKTKSLVTDGLNLTAAKDYTSLDVKTVNAPIHTDSIKLKTAAIELSSTFGVTLKFQLANNTKIKDVALDVTICDRTTTITDFTALEDGVYLVTFRGINATELDNTLRFVFKVNGENDAMYNYMVNTYLVNHFNADKLGDLCRALFNYGYSANLYKASIDPDFYD